MRKQQTERFSLMREETEKLTETMLNSPPAGNFTKTTGAFGADQGSGRGDFRRVPGQNSQGLWRAEGNSDSIEAGGNPQFGRISDTYTILEIVGSGSGGIVYKAYHKRLRKYVVLKKMRVPHRRLEENRRETDILKQLRHSYLPGVIDFINISGEIYTVMDFIEGESLERYIAAGRRFAPGEAVRYVTQLLEALAYLHSQTIPVIHGDIKPSNIMLTPDGNICLIDFNISGYLTDSPVVVAGYTAGYASPEQEQAIREAIHSGRNVRPDAIDVRSDLYSAAAVLYTLLTGMKPVRDWNAMQGVLVRRGISDGIIQVMYRALRPFPDDRYACAADMLTELRNYRKLESGYRKKILRRRIFVAAAAAAAIIAMIAAAFALQTGKGNKEKEYASLLASLETMADRVSDNGRDTENTFQGTGSYEQTGDKDILKEEGGGQSEQSGVSNDEAMDLYTRCAGLYPDRCAPKAEMARFLYSSGQYEECIRFIRGNVTDVNTTISASGEAADYGKVYYLLGSSYAQTGRPEEAVQAYSDAVDLDDSNAEYYRDYAIALARTGDSARAELVLEEAEQKGLAQAQTALVRGEICFNSGRYEEAAAYFTACIQEAQTDSDLLRAYLFAARAYEQMGITEENMNSAAELLEEARRTLSEEDRAPVLESLARIYIHLFDLTGENGDAQKGIRVFQEVIRSGWSTAMTYNNIIVLLQKTGDLDSAQEYAEEMTSRYPDDYRSFKRMAFLENALQENKGQEERDYRNFENYYLKARDFYEQQNDASEDNEMGILTDVYDQLVSKGWL